MTLLLGRNKSIKYRPLAPRADRGGGGRGKVRADAQNPVDSYPPTSQKPGTKPQRYDGFWQWDRMDKNVSFLSP